MYILYKVTRDGNTHTLFEADTFEEVLKEYKYYEDTKDSVYYVVNNEQVDVDNYDGLTDEERELL